MSLPVRLNAISHLGVTVGEELPHVFLCAKRVGACATVQAIGSGGAKLRAEGEAFAARGGGVSPAVRL
ncbi:MAG: hypothetical protein OXI83_00210 [Gemmatimonadota bacterium]|nr:hypothetical protein [Gemmatimonadota bacterium]